MHWSTHPRLLTGRVDPGDKSYSGISFFDQYRDVCKHGIYLSVWGRGSKSSIPVSLTTGVKNDLVITRGSVTLKGYGDCIHLTIKHLRWLADGAGAVKQFSHVGHSHQCDLSVFCPIRRDMRQQLKTSGLMRLRFGAFVGVSAKRQNELFQACKTNQDREIIAALTGIKGPHEWHCLQRSKRWRRYVVRRIVACVCHWIQKACRVISATYAGMQTWWCLAKTLSVTRVVVRREAIGDTKRMEQG